MGALWQFLTSRQNRTILTWLGGGAVVIIGGLWAGFLYFDDKKPASTSCVGAGGVTVGRDVNGSIITTNGSGATDCGKSVGKG